MKAINAENEYMIGITADFEEPVRKRISGRDLLKMKITIPNKPGSALWMCSQMKQQKGVILRHPFNGERRMEYLFKTSPVILQ